MIPGEACNLRLYFYYGAKNEHSYCWSPFSLWSVCCFIGHYCPETLTLSCTTIIEVAGCLIKTNSSSLVILSQICDVPLHLYGLAMLLAVFAFYLLELVLLHFVFLCCVMVLPDYLRATLDSMPFCSWGSSLGKRKRSCQATALHFQELLNDSEEAAFNMTCRKEN